MCRLRSAALHWRRSPRYVPSRLRLRLNCSTEPQRLSHRYSRMPKSIASLTRARPTRWSTSVSYPPSPLHAPLRPVLVGRDRCPKDPLGNIDFAPRSIKNRESRERRGHEACLKSVCLQTVIEHDARFAVWTLRCGPVAASPLVCERERRRGGAHRQGRAYAGLRRFAQLPWCLLARVSSAVM